MSFYVAQGTITAENGLQEMTAPGKLGGLVPRFAILRVEIGASGVSEFFHSSFGMASTDDPVGGVITGQGFVSVSSRTSGSTITRRLQQADRVIKLWNVTDFSDWGQLQATKFIAEGLQVTWLTAPNAPYTLHYELWAGDSINALVASVDTSDTSPISVTGLGAEPDLSVGLSTRSNMRSGNSVPDTHANVSVGYALNQKPGVIQRSINVSCPNGQSSVTYERYQSALELTRNIHNGSVFGDVSIQSFDPDGATFYRRTGSGTRGLYALVSLGGPQVALDWFPSTIGSNVTVNAPVGFKPRTIHIVGGSTLLANLGNLENTDALSWSSYLDDDGNAVSIGQHNIANNSSSVPFSVNHSLVPNTTDGSAIALLSNGASETYSQEARIDSVDATSFTVRWAESTIDGGLSLVFVIEDDSGPTGPLEDYYDHFTAIDSQRWAQVTEGSGSLATNNSELEVSCPAAADAAYVVHNEAIPTDEDKAWAFICRDVLRPTDNDMYIGLWNVADKAAILSGGTAAALLPEVMSGVGFSAAGGMRITYYDGANINYWDTSIGVEGDWSLTPTDVVACRSPGHPDWNQVKLQIDGANARFRWCVLHDVQTSELNNNQGLRHMAVTSWIGFSNWTISEIYLTLGCRFTDSFFGAWNCDLAHYDSTPQVLAHLNSKNQDGASYDIKYARAGEQIAVPYTISGTELPLGPGGKFDSFHHRVRRIFDDEATYEYLIYEGASGNFGPYETGIARRPRGGGFTGAWTKLNNGDPIITRAMLGTGYNVAGRPNVTVINDPSAPINRRCFLWIGAETTDPLWRIFLFASDDGTLEGNFTKIAHPTGPDGAFFWESLVSGSGDASAMPGLARERGCHDILVVYDDVAEVWKAWVSGRKNRAGNYDAWHGWNIVTAATSGKDITTGWAYTNGDVAWNESKNERRRGYQGVSDNELLQMPGDTREAIADDEPVWLYDQNTSTCLVTRIRTIREGTNDIAECFHQLGGITGPGFPNSVVRPLTSMGLTPSGIRQLADGRYQFITTCFQPGPNDELTAPLNLETNGVWEGDSLDPLDPSWAFVPRLSPMFELYGPSAWNAQENHENADFIVTAWDLSTGVLLPLNGEIQSTGYVEGQVGVTKSLSGLIESTGFTEGAVDVDKALNGLIESTGYVEGSVDVDKALNGTVESTGYVEGTLTPKVKLPLEGLIESTGYVTGSIGGDVPINGVISSTGYVEGRVDKHVDLSGDIESTGFVTGTLTRQGTKPLQGLIESTGFVSEILPEVHRGISGLIESTGYVQGLLSDITEVHPLYYLDAEFKDTYYLNAEFKDTYYFEGVWGEMPVLDANETIPEDSDLILVFRLRDGDGASKDLTGATWKAFDRIGTELLAKDSGAGIVLAPGEAQVTIDRADTKNRLHIARHELRGEDSLGRSIVMSKGSLTVFRSEVE